MDYYLNADKLCDNNGNPLLPGPSLSGIQYSVINDLNGEPVTLSDFKAHARIDFDTDDTLCDMYLKSARQYLEGWAQRSFGVKTIRLTALNLPRNYRLMYGPVASIATSGFESVGDILKGGPYTDVSIEFTTEWLNMPEAVKVAICRYAAGLYAIRENLIFSVNGVPHEPEKYMDEAMKILLPFSNVTFP